jgi:acetolactate synthase I/II/III large subunit
VRLADYVIRFLEERGIGHAFLVAGGASAYLCDALAKARSMGYVACHHEGAAAMAAEAYARVRTGLGLAVVTSGPGGTNAITGVAGAWHDHVPMVVLSGQVFTGQMVRGTALRQKGIQEVDIVRMVGGVTKHSAVIREPASIRFHLEKAVHLARSGRPGPVWLDIPADVQKAEVDPAKLGGYVPFAEKRRPWQADLLEVVDLLKQAKRPLLHIGQGVRLAGAQDALFDLLEQLRVPVVTARNGNDLIASDHELYVGRPGTFAQRGANFAVQACDLYIAVGTRLSLAQTGYNAKDYARRAKVVMVDVDRAELDKGTCRVDVKIQADAREFLQALSTRIAGEAVADWQGWLERCKAWQAKYPPVTPAQREQRQNVNSYHLIEALGAAARPDDVIVTDMGFAFQNTHQAWPVKAGQRLMTNCGLAAMGWGLPASIGAAVGGARRVLCIAGDGGFMMTGQELATARHHNLPIKIFLLNNGGYLTMRQSQEHAFGSTMASGPADLSFPDFRKLASAHDVASFTCHSHLLMREDIENALASDGPYLLELKMDSEQAQVPKSINRRDDAGNIQQTPIEDAWPFLPREEMEENLSV